MDIPAEKLPMKWIICLHKELSRELVQNRSYSACFVVPSRGRHGVRR